jgi:hypothetical protein
MYQRKKTDVEWQRKRAERLQRNQEAWRLRNPEKYAAQHQRAIARRAQRLRDDPEFKAQWLAQRNEAYRVLRLKRGLPIREKYVGTTNAVVPVGPFRVWLRAVVDLEPVSEHIGGDRLVPNGREVLASKLGTTDRTIYRLLNEGQPWISVKLADAAVTGYDRTIMVAGRLVSSFHDLYGDRVPLEVRPSDARKIFGDSFSGEVLDP